ncbi:MAG TPA: hypothetical protein VEV87_04220 [Chitinophagaceae bacterium]|nr:hypothetical protein [Chitinophagaceae bacterium]
MKNCITLISCLILLVSYSASQEQTQTYSTSASQAYAELFGAGGLYSFNYDQRFTKTEKGIGFRAGFSLFGGSFFDDDGGESVGLVVILPVGLNFLVGGKGHYFETGLGATPVLATGGGGGVAGFAQLGYRYQPFQKQGFTFRANLTPIVGEGTGLLWFGLSGGFRW